MHTEALALPGMEHGMQVPSNPDAVLLSLALPSEVRANLVRMFRDPYLLDKEERVELVRQLSEAVMLEPGVPELRVFLGMALCVDCNAQTALEEFREAVRLAPDNFLARLKFGELLMRLRVCSQAAEETAVAAQLAANAAQSELARRQAATIRTMLREGIERGGYGRLRSVFERIGRLLPRASQRETVAVTLQPR
jgi:lipoprotein NlpI